jgi:alkyldihydroxyacetonephosphate synthase
MHILESRKGSDHHPHHAPHHHAIGVDHRDYLEDEDGRAGVAALRAVKKSLDPSGLMNPGKLL